MRVLLSALLICSTATWAETLYHDFGGLPDFDQKSTMFFNPQKPDWAQVWVWPGKAELSFHQMPDGSFRWVRPPTDKPVVSSRAVKFRREAKLRINAQNFPTDQKTWLTIRYKDDLVRPAIAYSSAGQLTFGGKFDHRWKLQQWPIPAGKLRKENGRILLTFGRNYKDDLAGMLEIDAIQLATDPSTKRFPADAPGFWPNPTTENRHTEIGRNQEWIPGQPFFMYGVYATYTMVTHGGGPRRCGTGPKDTWRILGEHHFNTVVIHGWNQHWGSRWAVYPKQKPWASPGVYVEPGFDEYIFQGACHGLKTMANPLTDTRAYWIGQKPRGWATGAEDWRKVVQRHANNPDVIGWNPVDEWDHENVAYAKPHSMSRQLYQITKDADPSRPVMTSLMGYMGRVGWEASAATADVLANDAYFNDKRNLEEGARRQADNLDLMREVYGGSKGIVAILHAGDKQKWHNREKRLPNQTEIVFQAYYTIAHGAQGLLYFAYVPPYKPGYTGLDSQWAGYKQLGEELFGDEGIVDALVYPAQTIDIMGENKVVSVSEPDIDTILKRAPDGTVYLIAVNMRQSDRKVRITVKGLQDGAHPVKFENRNMQASRGTFSDTFGRFERRVYQLKGSF